MGMENVGWRTHIWETRPSALQMMLPDADAPAAELPAAAAEAGSQVQSEEFDAAIPFAHESGLFPHATKAAVSAAQSPTSSVVAQPDTECGLRDNCGNQKKKKTPFKHQQRNDQSGSHAVLKKK